MFQCPVGSAGEGAHGYPGLGQLVVLNNHPCSKEKMISTELCYKLLNMVLLNLRVTNYGICGSPCVPD